MPVPPNAAASVYGSHMRGYLPAGYLTEHRSFTDQLAVAITNVLAHMAASLTRFRQEYLANN